MKYVDEFRDPALTVHLSNKLSRLAMPPHTT